MIDRKLKISLDLIDAKTGTDSTEEQQEFASDFTKPLMSFSNPGTGKSHSIIKGLIMAQTVHGIPGSKINAMSFTQEATFELKRRYDLACKACALSPTIQFHTFHSICRAIVKDQYPSMEVISERDKQADVKAIEGYLQAEGVDTDEDNYFAHRVLTAIDSLNNSMVFDTEHVKSMYKFKILNMPVETFQNIRKKFFTRGLTKSLITRGEIPMYALFVLANFPHIAARYKARFKVMVVDEFQDMTKMYLVILSMITDNLIVIGDMKQQIYGFNGACAEIVQEYMKFFPEARRVDLTQSFRCKNEISEYATKIYSPNDPATRPFKGTSEGGTINIIKDKDLKIEDIVRNVKEEFDKEDRHSAKETMFLFRNNFSITPVAEELYRQGVPFRMGNKFKMVMELPIYNYLCGCANLALHPADEYYINTIPDIFPEYKNCRGYCSFIDSWRKTMMARHGKETTIFDVPHRFKEESSEELMTLLMKANEYIKQYKTAKEVLDLFLPFYEEYIIKKKWWMLDMAPEYYHGLVESIVTKKTFPQMVREENDKGAKIRDANQANMGVKCYTMHSAKGLEADDVYIIDAEAAFFPNNSHIKKYIDESCEIEAARAVREERNLLYVAITRAKSNVYITYNSELTELLSSPMANKYSYLDAIYMNNQVEYDDVSAFAALFNMTDKVSKIVHNGENVIKSRVAEDESYMQLADTYEL